MIMAYMGLLTFTILNSGRVFIPLKKKYLAILRVNDFMGSLKLGSSNLDSVNPDWGLNL